MCACVCCYRFILFGVENVSVQLEEPFRTLCITSLCDAVEAAARELHTVDSSSLASLMCSTPLTFGADLK